GSPCGTMSGDRGFRPVMYLGATATSVVDLPYESTPMGLYFNRNNEGGETADGDDYRILIRTDTGAVTIQKGDGAGGYVQATLNAEARTARMVEFGPWSVEYRISRSEVTSPDGRFRLQFLRRFSLLNIWYDMGWPDNAHPTRPDVWPVFMVNDANIPPSDSRPPRVRVTLSPGEDIARGTPLTIRAVADDDVDLARISFSYPGGERTCTFGGSDDRTAVCEFLLDTSGLRLGWHAVYAEAVDHRGAVGYSGAATFFVLAGSGDGQPPKVSVRYQYQNGTMYDDEDDEIPDRHDITFFANASDPDGIRRIDIEVRFDAPLPGSGRRELSLLCYGSGGEVRTEISCQNREIINTGPLGSSAFVVARYRAVAEDLSGERKETPWQYLVLTERLPDHDDDDLPTVVERRIGTNPGDPDTDRDTLIDGLEVLGMTPAGYVELPSLGADPLRKDVFVQIDYERGLGYSQADLDYFRNNLRRRGITLHVEQNERPPRTPGGAASCTAGNSTVDAVQAAALRDDRGNYYFPPARNWTHIYVYVRWLNGRSGYVGLPAEGYVNIDGCIGTAKRSDLDLRYRLIHEVGHALMLGHGGWNTVPPETRRPHKYLIEYRGGWNRQSWQPNYRSIMNYLYSFDANPVIDPVNRRMLTIWDYTWTGLPSLDESNLDERASSTFATALRALSAPPGYVPVIKYRCIDPDEVDSKGPFRYEVWSDGNRMLARQRLARDNTESGWTGSMDQSTGPGSARHRLGLRRRHRVFGVAGPVEPVVE
ncbi:MAG: hypothetical protein Q9O62_08630, partial [Ardenticatenia bacterium]|nr:hypothetical protein [Ardenticatenia bacterium]